MKVKDTPVIIFYILYFGWLFTVTFLTPDPKLLNYFSVGIVIFYFVFLGKVLDVLWFIPASAIPLLIQIISFYNWELKFDVSSIQYVPAWLPLSWGTTAVALRKFYFIILEAKKTYTVS